MATFYQYVCTFCGKLYEALFPLGNRICGNGCGHNMKLIGVRKDP